MNSMITDVILPQLGDTMDAATITRWFKQPGDAVKKGEPLFEVLTDKANIEVEATASGFLRRVLHQENETVPTGNIIAYITTLADEALAPSPLAHLPRGDGDGERTEILPSPGGRSVGDEGQGQMVRRKPFISPRARRVAKEFGVDVALLVPTSKTGRVMEADVRKFMAQAPAPTPPAIPPVMPTFPALSTTPPGTVSADALTVKQDAVTRVEGVRKIIFDRMGASAREIARVTLTTEADATRLVELREEINSRQSDSLALVKFSFTDFLILLVSRALLKYPYMNATLREDGVHQHAFVNLGVAADTERGLLVPVIRDAHRKGLGEIFAEVRRLSDAARSGKIAPEDLRGGTFTLTNLGAQEIDAFAPIVNQPEIAILGVGRIVQKPAAYQGQLALRWMVSLSLSFDHRIVDGAPAGKFLQHVKHLVEAPGLAFI